MRSFQIASDLSIDQQHAAVLTCCEGLLTALKDGRMSDIGSLRMELAGLLHANLSREEKEINSSIRRTPEAKRPHLFNELAAEASLLRERYTSHIGQWTLSKLQGDRDRYAQDARSLVQDVRSHLKKKQAAMPEWISFISRHMLKSPANPQRG